MFIIINGQLQGSNEIKVYESLTADLTFDFKGATFENTDTFQLSINNGAVVNSNYGFYKHGLITFAGVNFAELASESEVYIKISRNGSDYFADDFTVTFTSISVENDPIYTQDSANLATKSYVSSAVAGLASESYVSSAVAGLASQNYVQSAVETNKAFIRTDNTPMTSGLNLEYYPNYNVFVNEVTVTSATLQINPVAFNVNTMSAGEISTFENWIKITSNVDVQTISIDEDIKVIGNMPETLEGDNIQVFVRRLYKDGQNNVHQAISYGYDF